jgi:hypothetical protein
MSLLRPEDQLKPQIDLIRELNTLRRLNCNYTPFGPKEVLTISVSSPTAEILRRTASSNPDMYWSISTAIRFIALLRHCDIRWSSVREFQPTLYPDLKRSGPPPFGTLRDILLSWRCSNVSVSVRYSETRVVCCCTLDYRRWKKLEYSLVPTVALVSNA